MIILRCMYCKNDNLTPARTYPETYCAKCERVLQLWEMHVVHYAMKITVPAQTKVSERTAPTANQNGV